MTGFPNTDPTYQILNMDCREYLNGPFAPMFDFIIADPPFNLGRKYDIHNDSMSKEDYRKFTCEWVLSCWNRLKPGAAFCCHASVKASREILRACFQLNLDDFIEAEICWAYNFGQCNFNTICHDLKRLYIGIYCFQSLVCFTKN